MYSEDQYDNKFIAQTINAIEENDITSEFLGIMSLPNINNLGNTLDFFRNMISPPPEDNIKVAIQNLIVNKLMYPRNHAKVGRLTPMSKICSTFGKYGVEIGRMLIASYYFGCMKQSLILAAITFTASESLKGGYNDFFKINKEDKEMGQKQMKHISKYYHPYGEHFTLYNVYVASRNPLIFDVSEDEPSINKKYKKRDEWAKQNYINHFTLEKVDAAYRELFEKFRSLYSQIRLGNFFKIKDFPEHEAFKREMKRTPFAPQMGGGVVLYQRGSMPSYFFSKQDGTTLEELLQEPSEEYEFVMAGGKKKNKKPFVKKEPEKDRVLGTKDNYIKKYMVEVKKEDPDTKLFQDKLADFQEKDRLEKQLKRNQKQIEEYIKQSGRQEGATTPKDKAYNILDKINLFEIDECKEISRFKSIPNNMAVCLFYGYHTHIASYIRDGNNQSMNYLVKNIDPKKPYIPASIKKTIFQTRNERPSVIIYGKCTIMNNMATFSLVSKLPLNIIKKLVHTLPQ
jgi:HrpA-like RNA helicase